MPILVDGLSKRFGDRCVVADASFEVAEGELTTLLGPSGSGKSTLLRIIAGLETPDAGTIGIHGVDVTRRPPRERDVGFVFQQLALFHHLNVFENIAFGLRLRRYREDEIRARVAELIRLVRLDGCEAQMPAKLSGGQQQRVALARALAPQPRVLLLDEPFGSLDARVREELRAWLRQFHREFHVTILMVTHDQEEALELSDRVVVLNAGRVEQIGAPTQIYDHPATRFVAGFIGAANVLQGCVRDGRVALGPFVVPVDGSDGQEVDAFVRPHDIELFARPEHCSMMSDRLGIEHPVIAHVLRVIPLGWQVKLHLVLSDGQPLVVHSLRAQVETLQIREGKRVFLYLRDAKMFGADPPPIADQPRRLGRST